MNEADLIKRFDDESRDKLGAAATIRVTACDQHGGPVGETAVVVRLIENLSRIWQSGDCIAFWANGDHTCLDGLEFELIDFDLFRGES